MRIRLKGLKHKYDAHEQVLEIEPQAHIQGPIYREEFVADLAESHGDRNSAMALDAGVEALQMELDLLCLRDRMK